MTVVARTLRRESTPAEKRLWEFVRGRRCDGWRFVRQAPVAHFVIDFYCPQVRLAIELDGSIHEEESVRALDVERQKLLEEEQRISFLRLRNEVVLQSTESELSRIVQVAIAEAAAKHSAHPHLARRI